VIVGSYVPEGIGVIDSVFALARGVRAFYDIDTPVTLARLDAADCPYIAAEQIGRFDLYLSFTGGPILDRLATVFGARRSRAFYCAVDDTAYRPLSLPFRWDLGYLGTYSPDRQPMLERLLIEPARRLPQRRFVVAGPQYPGQIDWPANVERIDHLAPADHPRFYNSQRFTLNVTRADMRAAGWSPSVRLFEAAACGTPVISDRWPGLTELFPENDAIVTANDADAVMRALSGGEVQRSRLAERARSIVLAGHTGEARAAQLEQLLSECAPRCEGRTLQATA
jgi:spore maturation protein CgeB